MTSLFESTNPLDNVNPATRPCGAGTPGPYRTSAPGGSRNDRRRTLQGQRALISWLVPPSGVDLCPCLCDRRDNDRVRTRSIGSEHDRCRWRRQPPPRRGGDDLVCDNARREAWYRLRDDAVALVVQEDVLDLVYVRIAMQEPKAEVSMIYPMERPEERRRRRRRLPAPRRRLGHSDGINSFGVAWQR